MLRSKYMEPPFSVLDTKNAHWRKRKRRWLSLGIKSELGRDALSFTWTKNHLEKCGKGGLADKGGTSIFDPVLAELMYNWFCPEGGTILDPFAGGSVRGIVAHYLGFKYVGVELRGEQVKSNKMQARVILPKGNQPKWIEGDSHIELQKKSIPLADFVFSCPPYMNMEVYSDHPSDLSNMDDEKFIKNYTKIIYQACRHLKKGGFACFVVGDIRGKDGFYKDFLTITKRAFYKSEMKLYNEMVLLNMIGSAMLRANIFEKSKKLVKTHQNVFVFKKG